MRTVIIGEPNKLKRVRLRDLPADKNLDDSFWRYVDLSRLDLRAYSMENVDIIDYKATSTKFPSCHYSQFRFPVDNTGITIPPDVSSYNHDFVVEVFRQAPNASDPIIQRIADYVSGGYDRSWRDGIHHMMQAATPATVFNAMATAVVGYPLLISRLRAHRASGAFGPEKERTQDLTRFRVGEDEINLAVPPSFDRWATARMLETQIGKRVRVWLPQLHPTPIVMLDDGRKEKWWEGWEQNG